MSQTIPPALTDPVLSSPHCPQPMVWPSHCLLSLSLSSHLFVFLLQARPCCMSPLLPLPQSCRLLSVPQGISPAGWSSSDTVSSLVPSRTPLLDPASFCKGPALGLPPLAATLYSLQWFSLPTVEALDRKAPQEESTFFFFFFNK